MKTPFTREGYPSDIVARWKTVEENITQEHEEYVLSILRHVALGCSVCRQEEVIVYLAEWPNKLCVIREALVLIDVLMAQYLFSLRGKKEMSLLRDGMTPVLQHTDKGPATDDGFPCEENHTWSI